MGFMTKIKDQVFGDIGGPAGDIAKAGATMYDRSKMTPEEEAAYKQNIAGFGSTSSLIDALNRYEMGLGKAPAGYDPYKGYEDTLAPELEAVNMYINQQFGKRGMLRSGLNIEGMGRAGAELAVKKAAERMAYKQQGLQNLYGQAGLYGQGQQYGLTGMNRQAGVAQAAAEYEAYPAQAALGSAYGNRAAFRNNIYSVLGSIAGSKGGSGVPGGGTSVPMQNAGGKPLMGG